MRTLSIGVFAIGLAGPACTVNQTSPPSLAGPSDFARSIYVSATPDMLYLNGEQSVVTIEARDATGGPLANERVHLSIVLDGSIADSCGHLTLSDIITGSDGRAATVFTAPTLPLPQPECQNLGSDGVITIQASPIGTNFQTVAFSRATIRLRTPPAGSSSATSLSVNFSVTPNGANPRDFVFADAGSVSPGHTITSYRWNWSDGASENGAVVTHDFSSAGTYTATLTVTDDIGQSGFKTGLLTAN